MPKNSPEAAGRVFRAELEKFGMRAIEGAEEKYQLLLIWLSLRKQDLG